MPASEAPAAWLIAADLLEARLAEHAGAASAGRTRAAHVVALGPVGRHDEFADGQRITRATRPELHDLLSLSLSDVPSDLREIIRSTREYRVNAILSFASK